MESSRKLATLIRTAFPEQDFFANANWSAVQGMVSSMHFTNAAIIIEYDADYERTYSRAFPDRCFAW